MSIQKAINRAYRVAQERKYNAIYWALDLHGTCIESNYKQGNYSWLNEHCAEALRYLSEQEETHLIIWSSLHQNEIPNVVSFFVDHGIKVAAVNSNPMEASTTSGCFDQKFYMSIIVDDKAGFDPDEWPDVVHSVKQAKQAFGFST